MRPSPCSYDSARSCGSVSRSTPRGWISARPCCTCTAAISRLPACCCAGLAAATEAAQLEYHTVGWSAALGWLAWEENRWADAVMHLEPSARRWRSG